MAKKDFGGRCSIGTSLAGNNVILKNEKPSVEGDTGGLGCKWRPGGWWLGLVCHDTKNDLQGTLLMGKRGIHRVIKEMTIYLESLHFYTHADTKIK